MGITIDKAIDLLNQLPLMLNTASDHDNHVAVQLGIEALKRVKQCCFPPYGRIEDTLPGETKE